MHSDFDWCRGGRRIPGDIAGGAKSRKGLVKVEFRTDVELTQVGEL